MTSITGIWFVEVGTRKLGDGDFIDSFGHDQSAIGGTFSTPWSRLSRILRFWIRFHDFEAGSDGLRQEMFSSGQRK